MGAHNGLHSNGQDTVKVQTGKDGAQLENIVVGPDSRGHAACSISTRVRFPAELLADPCRSPSPEFWRAMLQPIRLLSAVCSPPGDEAL